ncbi:MAG: signal peptidase I [Bacilli bacterium]|nr:signal peptidase I [Bacilli bacterium]
MNKEKVKKIIKELYPYIVIIIVVVLFRTFIATPVRVDGDSMDSTLKDGDILILNKLNNSYERFDVVVINNDGTKLIKRIIGLPGEYIEYIDNDLYINGKKIKDIETSRTADFSLKELYNLEEIPEGYYFVLGDNRGNSVDSRDYRVGLVKETEIEGITTIRLFPFNKIGNFN